MILSNQTCIYFLELLIKLRETELIDFLLLLQEWFLSKKVTFLFFGTYVIIILIHPVTEQYMNEVLLQDYKRKSCKPVIFFVLLYENHVVCMMMKDFQAAKGNVLFTFAKTKGSVGCVILHKSLNLRRWKECSCHHPCILRLLEIWHTLNAHWRCP